MLYYILIALAGLIIGGLAGYMIGKPKAAAGTAPAPTPAPAPAA